MFLPINQSYAVGMECQGMKDIVTFNNGRDAQILTSLIRSFPDKTVELSSWSDDGMKALLKIKDSSTVTDTFLLNLENNSLEFIVNNPMCLKINFIRINPINLLQVMDLSITAT